MKNILFLSCLFLSVLSKAQSKIDTICILKVQNTILNSRKTLDTKATKKYGQIILEKTKRMAQHKHKVMLDTSDFVLSPRDKQIFLEISSNKKKPALQDSLTQLIKNHFKQATSRHQLLVIQNASYDPMPAMQSNMMRVYSPLNENQISFFLFDNLDNKFIFMSESNSKSDPRDAEQTERQILKGLKKLYYGL